MTKIQYFLLLWFLSSMFQILSIAQYGLNCMGYTGLMCLLVSAPWSIAVHGCALFFGIYFAQNIGIRLLFLNENYSIFEDIIKPAVLVGSLYAVIMLVVNWLMPFDFIVLNKSSCIDLLRKFLPNIRFDLFFLLFCICGLAFVIKKILKNTSLSLIVPICVILAAILPLFPFIFSCLIRSHCDRDAVIRQFFVPTIYIVLGMLFWKKGLEVALLCSIVITTILYFIAPLLLNTPHINMYI